MALLRPFVIFLPLCLGAALRLGCDSVGQPLGDHVDEEHGRSTSHFASRRLVLGTDLEGGVGFGAIAGAPEHFGGDPLRPADLYVPIIRGGLGDALRQLVWAIMYAEQNNFTTVEVTQQAFQKHFEGFLQIPEDAGRTDTWGKLRPITIAPPEQPASASCSVGATTYDPADARPSFHCAVAPPLEWARVLRKYIRPLVVPLPPGQRVPPFIDRELVIHIRSGDAMTTTSPLAKMEIQLPPCAFYDKIIEEGDGGNPFQHVRIVTQNDTNNPCVRLTTERHMGCNITVQHESREEDAATIMTAQHLVLAPSYFSFLLAQMNERVQTIFYAQSDAVGQVWSKGIVPCGKPGDAKVVGISVPGIDEERSTLAERTSWMAGYSAEQISIASTC